MLLLIGNAGDKFIDCTTGAFFGVFVGKMFDNIRVHFSDGQQITVGDAGEMLAKLSEHGNSVFYFANPMCF